jgi:hypothetical protein
LSFSERVYLCTKLELGKLNLAAHLVQRIKDRPTRWTRHLPAPGQLIEIALIEIAIAKTTIEL